MSTIWGPLKLPLISGVHIGDMCYYMSGWLIFHGQCKGWAWGRGGHQDTAIDGGAGGERRKSIWPGWENPNRVRSLQERKIRVSSDITEHKNMEMNKNLYFLHKSWNLLVGIKTCEILGHGTKNKYIRCTNLVIVNYWVHQILDKARNYAFELF